MQPEDWAKLFERLIQRDHAVQDAYNDAEACLLCVSDDHLGTVRCAASGSSRRCAAGRWQETGRPSLRLIDNTEQANVEVELFEFGALTGTATPTLTSDHGCAADPAASRLRAQVGRSPPPSSRRAVHHLQDLQARAAPGARHEIASGSGCAIDCAELWVRVRPADPFAERRKVKVVEGDHRAHRGAHRRAALAEA